MSRKSIFLAMSFLALVALALAACTPTEVVKTVIVTQEVVTEGETVIQEVVVTATPEPEVPVEAEPRTLVVCQGQEPDTLYIWGGSMLAASSVREAFMDGSAGGIDNRSFDYQPIILEKLPSLADGDAVVNVVPVAEGDTVVDNDGNPATLTAKTADAPGTMVRPAGCRSADCAVEYDGTNVTEMDQMEVTFKLLPDLLWSDGTPLTAADSVYSFGLYMDPDTVNPTRYAGERTASYEAPDDLTNVWTGMPGYMDSVYFTNFFAPLPQHVLGQYTAADLMTAYDTDLLYTGYGPYIIDTWEKGVQMTGHKNPNYFRASEGLPKFDNIVYRFVGTNANAAVAAILAGECDIVTQDAALDGLSQLLLELQAAGQLDATFVTGTAFEHADFNIQPFDTIKNTGDFAGWDQDGDGLGPFGDARLRQAVAMCMDRQQIIDTVLFGQSVIPLSYVPSAHPLANPDAKSWPYDVAAAGALLDEIGWLDDDGDPATPRKASGVTGVPDGTALAFTLETTTATVRQQYTQILQQNLAECGMEATLNYYTATEYFADPPDAKLAGRRYDLDTFTWLTGVQPSCDLYLSTQIDTPDNGWAGQNWIGYSNPEFDAACNKGLQSLPGEDAYVQGHMDAQRIFAEDLPSIPLYLRIKLAATRPDMCNFIMDPTANTEMWNVENFDYGECDQ